MRVLKAEEGATELLLGNEAVVRGALEAGVSVAATYPGTPSSEIGDTFWELRRDYPFHFEYSANEKVALEVAAAAAVSGVRAMVSMKHVGLNVAADSFVTTGYVGTRGGLVVVVADDPSMHSSQNEQDTRIYGRLANLPVLEPGTPQEAREYAMEAFELSERLKVPVILRLTTRVSHTRAPVELGSVGTPELPGEFEADPARFVPVPSNAYRMRRELLECLDEARELAERHRFNRLVDGAAPLGIVTSGTGTAYVREIAKRLDVELPMLLLGFSHPLPAELVAEFASDLEAILVVEETEPVLEADVKAALFDAGELMPVYGRRSGHMPRQYELTPGIVEKAVRELLAETAPELELPPRSESVAASAPAVELPSRSPVLCPGCPHRHTYYAAKRAVTALKRKGLEPIFPSDIGCYSLGLAPPFHMADIMLSMGASVGTAGGFDAATEQPVVAFIGDSTFFHAGLPALASAVHNGHNFTLVILDNRTTAMTGHQPHPGIELRAPGDENRVELHELSIPAAVRGLGVPWVAEVDPNQLQETQKKVREAVEFDGVSVVVSQAPCVLLSRHEVPDTTYSINLEVCADCGVCIERFGCPAIVRDEGVLKIDARLCNSCGVCMQVCPHDAIEEVPADES